MFRLQHVLCLGLLSCTWIPADLDGDGTRVGEDCDDRLGDLEQGIRYFGDPDLDGFGSGEGEVHCEQPPFSSTEGGDCLEDPNVAVFPGAPELCDGLDNDCDATIDEGCVQPHTDDTDDTDAPHTARPTGLTGDTGDTDVHTDAPTGHSGETAQTGQTSETGDTAGTADTAVHPPQITCHPDLDGDNVGRFGYGIQPADGICPPGYAPIDGDCNDTRADVFPGAPEVPGNFIDEDCSGGDDCYGDADGDGYGDPGAIVSTDSLVCRAGLSSVGTDCNDNAPSIHPGAEEICDGEDSDCNGVLNADEVDADNDGFPECAFDCDDFDPTVAVGTPEDCTDNIDRDCNGDPATARFYFDLDGDGIGGTNFVDTDCVQPANTAFFTGDCDDHDPLRFPGNPELTGSGRDEDCDGINSCYLDADNDGDGVLVSVGSATCNDPFVAATPTDCDDNDPAVNTLAAEVIDPHSIDENCDGLVLCWSDADEDGFGGAPAVLVGADVCFFPHFLDCDDTRPEAYIEAIEQCNGLDDDCDGELSDDEADIDTDGFAICSSDTVLGGDCDDLAPLENPGQPEEAVDGIDQDCDGVDHCYPDADLDGFGAGVPVPGTSLDCDTAEGFSANDDDCDDTSAASFPGNLEVCDGLDNDCHPSTSAGDESDDDNDGFTVCGGDCDDGNPEVNPGVPEDCNNGIDDNCDGLNDQASTNYLDADGDGFGDGLPVLDCFVPPHHVALNGDCNDADPNIHPNAIEIADNPIDENCDGLQLCRQDADGDGFGTNDRIGVPSCTVLQGGDCNDNAETMYPGHVEICDGLDNDCNSVVPTDELDLDIDGFVTCSGWSGIAAIASGDCDDAASAVRPNAPELCNGNDDDCDGLVPTDELDSDADGQVLCDGWIGSALLESGDCNDADPSSFDGAVELCDGVRNDCGNLSPLSTEIDADLDTFVLCTGWIGDSGLTSGDCDDTNPAIKPGVQEIGGDGIDQNCDGLEACWSDLDGDTYGGAEGFTGDFTCSSGGFTGNEDDCDDTDGGINPGASEVCDGIDNDCSGSADFANHLGGELDGDLDGEPLCNDCDETGPDAALRSFAFPEICGNTIDENCDGMLDGGLWYADVDGDGYGDPATALDTCLPHPDWITRGGDCNDQDPALNPDAEEIHGDDIDQDCDGDLSCFVDNDGDLYGSTSLVALPNTAGASCSSPGAAANDDDCDDHAAQRFPTNPEVCDGLDNDCNGQPQPDELDDDGDGYLECVAMAGNGVLGGDCNDSDPSIHPGAFEDIADQADSDCDGLERCHPDNDTDGYGHPTPQLSPDLECNSLLWTSTGTDCDDSNADVNPGADEVPNNNQDDDCDTFELCPVDSDGDGAGHLSQLTPTPILSCLGVNLATTNDDCNDAAFAVNPNATEICDGIDNDCVGGADFSNPFGSELVNADTDPELACNDCDDSDPTAYFGAVEVCGNGVDEDCNGSDEGDVYYPDLDGDNFGDESLGAGACSPPPGAVLVGDDCDDTNPQVNPNETDTPGDSIDQDCDGQLTCYVDLDGDDFGFSHTTVTSASTCNTATTANNDDDCDDANGSINPAVTETPNNGTDDDCDGFELCPIDHDLDTFGHVSVVLPSASLTCSGSGIANNADDCDDTLGTVNPNAVEICNGLDDDCHGGANIGGDPTAELDQDGDGALACEDCDDQDPGRYPGNVEICANGIDEDCDHSDLGSTFYLDHDSDGYGDPIHSIDTCSAPPGYVADNTDCNDSDGQTHPNAQDLSGDTIDQDCDGDLSCFNDADLDTYGRNTTTDLPGALTCVTSGTSDNSDDCNDSLTDPNAPHVNPGAAETPNDGLDQDCDGEELCPVDLDGDTYGHQTALIGASLLCTGAGVADDATDCNDDDDAIHPNANEICDGIDNDCLNGADFSTATTNEVDDFDGDGALSCQDCDDNDPAAYPGNLEVCGNDIDDDCVGGDQGGVYYIDADVDGYGNPTTGIPACSQPPHRVSNDTDCDDSLPSINPAATEVVANAVDENCDGNLACYTDVDADNFGTTASLLVAVSPKGCDTPTSASNAADCDDQDPKVNPDATEIKANGIDEDCDNMEACPDDADQDSHGHFTLVTLSNNLLCVGSSIANNANDCDDGDSTVNPDADEACDGIDNDCTGGADFSNVYGGELNLDGDPELACNDCDDNDAQRYFGNTEICANGIDDDCVGGDQGSTWYSDTDGDTFGDLSSPLPACSQPANSSLDSTDCDDSEPTTYPGATEHCDTVNNDCDELTDEDNLLTKSGTSWPTLAAAIDSGAGSVNLCGVVEGDTITSDLQITGLNNALIAVTSDATTLTVPSGVIATMSNLVVRGGGSADHCISVEGTLRADIRVQECNVNDSPIYVSGELDCVALEVHESSGATGGAVRVEGGRLTGASLYTTNTNAEVGGSLYIERGSVNLERLYVHTPQASIAGAIYMADSEMVVNEMQLENALSSGHIWVAESSTGTSIEIQGGNIKENRVEFPGLATFWMDGMTARFDNVEWEGNSGGEVMRIRSGEAFLRNNLMANEGGSVILESGTLWFEASTLLLASGDQVSVGPNAAVYSDGSTIMGSSYMVELLNDQSLFCHTGTPTLQSATASAPDLRFYNGIDIDLDGAINQRCQDTGCAPTLSCP